MKLCKANELNEKNFNVIFINALQQFWHTTKSFQCIGNPKKQNLFLFLNGCKITYTDKNDRVFVANSGDVVYTPVGSEYKARLSDFDNAHSHTVGINFLLFDTDGESLILSDDIRIFRADECQTISLLFQKALYYGAAHSLLKSRILLMEILYSLMAQIPSKSAPDYVIDSVRFLSEHVEENPSVEELAERFNISEVYFRKQFKAYLGVTPIEYRNSLRLERARSYLEYGEISVQEISDMLGYSTASHFIKEFGRKCGCTPLQYRKRVRYKT